MTPEKQQMIDWLHAHGACLDGRRMGRRTPVAGRAPARKLPTGLESLK